MSHDFQVTTFWTKVLTVAEKERLVQNVASSAANAADFIQKRVVRGTLLIGAPFS